MQQGQQVGTDVDVNREYLYRDVAYLVGVGLESLRSLLDYLRGLEKLFLVYPGYDDENPPKPSPKPQDYDREKYGVRGCERNSLLHKNKYKGMDLCRDM